MKVAILGCASSARMAPFYDDEWEIWGTGITGTKIPRWSRWFQLHDMDRLARGYNALEQESLTELVQWLVGFEGPVYMHQASEGIPGSVVYPFEDMLAKYGRNFRATAAWMLALAIHEMTTEHADEDNEIGIYGVDMGAVGEYTEQRPSVKFFEGWARGAGIKVTLTASSSLARCNFLYGYEDAKEAAFNEYEDVVEKRRADAEQRRINADAESRELAAVAHTLKLIREDRI